MENQPKLSSRSARERKSVRNPYSLFFPAPVEEAGPLKAGLFAAHPEHGGDANHQGHQVLHEEQNQVWTAHLSDLGRETHERDIPPPTLAELENAHQVCFSKRFYTRRVCLGKKTKMFSPGGVRVGTA